MGYRESKTSTRDEENLNPSPCNWSVVIKLGSSLSRSVRTRPVFRLFSVFRSKRETVRDGALSNRDGDGWELRKKTGKSGVVKDFVRQTIISRHSYFAILIEGLSVRGERNGRCQILVNSDWKFFCRMLSELTTVSQYCDSQRAYGNEKFWNGTETGRRR